MIAVPFTIYATKNLYLSIWSFNSDMGRPFKVYRVECLFLQEWPRLSQLVSAEPDRREPEVGRPRQGRRLRRLRRGQVLQVGPPALLCQVRIETRLHLCYRYLNQSLLMNSMLYLLTIQKVYVKPLAASESRHTLCWNLSFIRFWRTQNGFKILELFRYFRQ